MSVRCSSEGLRYYEAMRNFKKYRYIIFCIGANGFIDVETIGHRNNDYKQFLDDLMRNGPTECRYGLFDLEYTRICDVTKHVKKREKLVLLSWCPCQAKPMRKIQYISYLQQFLKQLTGTQYYKTVGEIVDLSRDEIEGYFH